MTTDDGAEKDGAEQDWVAPGLAQLFEIVLDAAADRRDLSISERDHFFSTGEQALASGGSLSGLVDDYLRGAGQLWEQVFIATDPGQAVEVGRSLRRVSEDAVAALAAGFETAQRSSIRAEEATRRELIDDVLNNSVDPGTFADRAQAAGFPMAATYLVAVAVTEHQLSDTGPIHATIRNGLASRAPQRDFVTFTKRGHLVVVAPDAGPDGLDVLQGALESLGPMAWRAGVGEPGEGPGGLHRGYREALEAVRLGRLFALDPFVHHRDLLPYRVMAADAVLARQLARSVIEPLVQAPRGSLLDTLEAFIEHGGNMAEVARRLSLGPRTVAYRLERIAELTGYSPREPLGRLALELAVRCRPLTGPEVPVGP